MPRRRMWLSAVPVLFLLVSAWLIVSTLLTTPGRALAGLGLMALGLPFYWYWSGKAGFGMGTRDRSETADAPEA